MNLNLKEGKVGEEKSAVRSGLYLSKDEIIRALRGDEEYGADTMAILVDLGTVGPDRLKIAGALSDKASLFVGPKMSGVQANCNIFFPLTMTGYRADQIRPRDYVSPNTLKKRERDTRTVATK